MCTTQTGVHQACSIFVNSNEAVQSSVRQRKVENGGSCLSRCTAKTVVASSFAAVRATNICLVRHLKVVLQYQIQVTLFFSKFLQELKMTDVSMWHYYVCKSSVTLPVFLISTAGGPEETGEGRGQAQAETRKEGDWGRKGGTSVSADNRYLCPEGVSDWHVQRSIEVPSLVYKK